MDPYSQMKALEKAGAANQLFTIPGGQHGQFTDEQNHKAYDAIRQFLAKHGLTPVR